MAIYYAIVDGDPITSGGHVSALRYDDTIEGPDGKDRGVAYLGDKAFCTACKTWGVIVARAGIADFLRSDHYQYGKQAVSGDRVACKCERMPFVIAVYGRRESMEDTSDSARVANAVPASSREIYDEQFVLRDSNGRALSNVRYRINSDDGKIFTGATDASGKTQRVTTNAMSGLKFSILDN
jgi:hypothetical protein